MEKDFPYDLNRLAYNSFVWNFGTTSFRTKQMNYSIERQLELLSQFWSNPDNAKCGWEKEYLSPNQPFGIYEIKNRYYDFMRDNGFVTGNDAIKFKAARQKTSGLVDIGVINRNHRITEVGEAILELAKTADYKSDNLLSIPKDSMVYLQQLLKYSLYVKGSYVRPFVVLLYLISKVGPLSYDEFTYLAPLCINFETTEDIVAAIPKIRNNETSIDEVIYSQICKQQNYKEAYAAWMDNDVTEDLVMAIGINRKSRTYDKPYFPLFNALKKLFLDGDNSAATLVLNCTKKIQIGNYWRELIFDTVSASAIKKNPNTHIKQTEFSNVNSEEELKVIFFKYLHLFKVKSMLHDYFDLNRRYIKLANVILFDDGQLSFDLVPKQFFNNAMDSLYQIAFSEADNLELSTSLEEICPELHFDEAALLESLNKDLGINLTTIDEALTEVERQRYERFNALVESRFSDEKLLDLLDNFDNRNDDEIAKAVSDNADVPTIFEYVLGVIWYKTSERKGKILDYLKLSLDADLLPVTHAAGGEADIVYEYKAWPPYYPQHNLLLEATLADGTNQRRMEMEPVSRHLGRHLLRTKNDSNYCVFATTYLDSNVISDFKARKHIPFIDPQNPDDWVAGMKIIPLSTCDLREIIKQQLRYRQLYPKFETAYNESDNYPHPVKWYESLVRINPL